MRLAASAGATAKKWPMKREGNVFFVLCKSVETPLRMSGRVERVKKIHALGRRTMTARRLWWPSNQPAIRVKCVLFFFVTHETY